MSTSSKDTPTSTNSVTNAEDKPTKPVGQHFFLEPQLEINTTNIKCGKCAAVTSHAYFIVQLSEGFLLIDPLELIQMSRRILLCQNCGDLRLIK